VSCVQVVGIRSRTGILDFVHGVEGAVQSQCTVPVTVIMDIGYYDGRGEQMGSGHETGTVGAGSVWRFYHAASCPLPGATASIRILRVQAFK
jgi:hypothetical protein